MFDQSLASSHGLEDVSSRSPQSLMLRAAATPDLKNHKLYVFFGLNFHYLIFLIGFLVRYNRHKSLGMINLMESRPKTYIIKLILQFVMVISSALMAADWDFSQAGYQFDPLALIYILYAILWCLSMYLQFFEYQRNLPHVWYAH